MHIRLQSRRGRSLAQTSLSAFTRVPVSIPCCCCLVLGLEFTSGSGRERDRWLLSHSSCLRTIHCRNPRPCHHIEAPDGRQTPSETSTHGQASGVDLKRAPHQPLCLWLVTWVSDADARRHALPYMSALHVLHMSALYMAQGMAPLVQPRGC